MPKPFDHACVELKDVSRIKLEEAGRKVVILNPAHREHSVVRIDGCVITEGRRADWLVSLRGHGCVIIELKGTDVAHALQQIDATLAHCCANDLLNRPVGALVMCRQVPKAGTNLQLAMVKLRRQYNAKLKVSSSTCEFELASLV